MIARFSCKPQGTTVYRYTRREEKASRNGWILPRQAISDRLGRREQAANVNKNCGGKMMRGIASKTTNKEEDALNKPIQIQILFDGPPLMLSGADGSKDRERFSAPEQQYPHLAGKMIRAYGAAQNGYTCGACRNYDRRKGCKVLMAGRRVVGDWQPSWAACRAFNVTDESALRRLRFLEQSR
jgi:hypothetical protein